MNFTTYIFPKISNQKQLQSEVEKMHTGFPIAALLMHKTYVNSRKYIFNEPIYFQAVDQPDVFETCELPEADQHHEFDVRYLKVII